MAHIKELITETNKVVKLLEKVNNKLGEVLGVMDRRSEESYNNVYHALEKIRCLEDYLGVKFKEGKEEIKRYIKKKKS